MIITIVEQSRKIREETITKIRIDKKLKLRFRQKNEKKND